MPLKLTWKDRNVSSDGTRIYRSDAPMDPTALPAPIATVAPGTMEFIDDAIEQNKIYYYRFEALKGTEKVLSEEKILGAFPYTGPGLNQPLRGDFKNGYFGTITPAELFTDIGLMDAVGNGVGTRLNALSKWLKYALDGKILFIPDGPVSANVTWDMLYRKGLVYGVDGPGLHPSTEPVVNQLTTVNKNEHQFIVRLPTGSNDQSSIDMTSNRKTDLSEWDRLFYPTCISISGGSKWDDITTADLTKSQGPNLCQDLGNIQANRLTRGASTSMSSLGATATYTNSVWRPVLELVL